MRFQAPASVKHAWVRTITGCMTALLLVPVPALATLTFGTWTLNSSDTTAMTLADAGNGVIDFTIFPHTNGSGTLTVTGSTTVTWDGDLAGANIKASYSGFDALIISQKKNVTFQATYGTTGLFGPA